VKNKLVYAENISQAAQFVQSGNAQAGILALALVLSPSMYDGERWLVPPNFYPRIQQGAVILKSSKQKEAANSFLQFAKSSAGCATFEKWGFHPPAQTSPQKNNEPGAKSAKFMNHH
jgi:molybdate transport system substrate-binding protein